MTELRSGTSVTPTLRLLRPLGQGGMGRVWIAEHLTLDTNVVVKFMATDIAATADGAARFAREASVAAAVKSPHVVQVFDHGVTPDGDAYIVMELLEGRDLAAQLREHGPMSAGDVAALVAQVAKALGKAHQVGVVHRDIKPDNIFLCDGDGGELFVKLLDFGIAKRDQNKVSGSATTTGAVIGTPYYMSPEQIVGEKDIDARTDIWSLGVVAFEAMTGRRPFQGTTVGAITLAIHTATPHISDHLPAAPPALDAWFARACARDPKERFQTPREAGLALQQAAAELATTSSPLLRAPMLSMHQDGVGDGSDPSLAASVAAASGDDPSSDGRAATHLSSVFPVPRPTRTRPMMVVGAVAVVALLVGAVFVVPALTRPSTPAVSSSNAIASASVLGAPSTSGTPAPSSTAATSGGAETAATAEPALPSPSSTSSAHAATPATMAPATAARPTLGAPATGARPTTSATSTKPPTKPTRPARTRDDDDIK